MKETVVEDRSEWVETAVSEEVARRVRGSSKNTDPVTMLYYQEPGVEPCKCWGMCVHQNQMEYFNRTGHHPMCEIHGEGKGE